MRKILLVIVIACFGMLACKKSASISPGIFGKWELRRQYGGFGGFDSTYKAGNGRIYQFNRDSSYKKLSNGKLIMQGVFHILKINYPSGSSSLEIRFDNNLYGELFTLNGTKLTIGTTATDGIAMDYVKIQNE